MATTKIMQVEQPEPLDDGQGNTFSLIQFIRFLIDSQPAFNSNMAGARSALRIEAALSKAESASVAAAKNAADAAKAGAANDAEAVQAIVKAAGSAPIFLEDRDLKKLVESAEDPQASRNPMTGQQMSAYPVSPARRLIGFVNALHAAVMVKVEDVEDTVQPPN
jgi:hypothetical protein